MEIYEKIDLQDCPCCGGAGWLEKENDRFWSVTCIDCGAQTAEIEFRTPELSDPFRWNKKTEAYMVDEKIKEVVIVTDEIDIPLEKYSIVTNRAVILRCEYNYYVFDREWYYGELIFIKIGKTMPELYSTEKVAYDWGDDGKNETIVKRTMTTL